MWSANFPNGLNGNASRGGEQHERYDGGREGLGFPVSERVIFIGRLRSNGQATPHHERCKDVSPRLDGVRHQRIGVTDHARHEFRDRERGIDENAPLRRANTESNVRHASTNLAVPIKSPGASMQRI